MPNNYLSVLYQHIIQVENKNVGLKVEGHKHTIAPPSKKSGGGQSPLELPTPEIYIDIYIYIYIYIYIHIYIYIYIYSGVARCQKVWGGAHRHVGHVLSLKNPNINEL